MRRPLYIGALFATCLAVGAVATVWLSATIFRLDREQQEYQRLAELEEKVRLALWRMDSALGPFIAAESMRPYSLYSAFYPATEAVNPANNDFYAQPILMPSPLLTFRSPYIRLHFQLDAQGHLSSPQVPDDEQLPLAQANYLAPGELVASIDRLVELKQLVHFEEVLNRVEKMQLARAVPIIELAGPPRVPTLEKASTVQLTNNASELHSRTNQAIVQQQAPPLKIVPRSERAQPHQEVAKRQGGRGDESHSIGVTPEQAAPDSGEADAGFKGEFHLDSFNDVLEIWGEDSGIRSESTAVVIGSPREWKEEPITPIWVGGELLLVRPVRAGGVVRLQGCWLDWNAINTWLLGLCKDLLPQATLVAVTSGTSDDPEMPGRQLASLPVRLAPGAVPNISKMQVSPVLVYLLASVGGIAAAALAIALLLWGAVALSERRAQFVSAVTHELRSPLTTFRLYTEMLAKGMIADEGKRQLYFETLHAEAGRLSHLVENVLAFARLERGRFTDRATDHPAGLLLANAAQRLEQRSAQAAMALEVCNNAGEAAVCVDPDILEQILYNLVDNACKYAATGADRRIHLEATSANGMVEFRVRDHGPGILRRDARRIFRPFTKSVHEAARSAPGVGLGLGLSRRLARSAGGSLRLEPVPEGASFVLSLPRFR